MSACLQDLSAQEESKGRRIVLLSDGTGNSSARIWRTNVWRTFEALDLSGDDQVAYYDDGVGTSEFKLFAILSGAIGYGLKRNVLDLYKFACRNYRSGSDEIFGFGFSRGAFTIRVVAGLIANQGLVFDDNEAELHRKALAAYRAYRADRYHTRWKWPENFFRALRDGFLAARGFRYDPSMNRKDVKIAFLGLWDTVAAYGMPIEAMSRGVNDWIWPLGLPDHDIDKRVQRVCHAVAIDDERKSFHPVLINEVGTDPAAPDINGEILLAKERISQVWFTGAHSNVGGGYPDDSLAHIPLCWMMSEASALGVTFKKPPNANPQTFEHALTAQDKDGRLYDPRGGLGAYYRYAPRDIASLFAKQGCGTRVRIHESVFRRIKNRAHAYAPIGVPGQYEVVTWDGKVVPQSASSAEAPDQGRARDSAQRAVWDRIWARGSAYVLTVLLTLALIFYPLFNVTRDGAERVSSIRWLSEAVTLLGSFLPNAASPWVEGYVREPRTLLIIAGVLAASLLLGGLLKAQIAECMDSLWRASMKGALSPPNGQPGLITRFREAIHVLAERPIVRKSIAPFASAALVVAVSLLLLNRVAFSVQDYAGLTCPETPPREKKTKRDELNVGDFVVTGGKTERYDYYRQRSLRNPTLTPEQRKDYFRFIPHLPTFTTSSFCQGFGVDVEKGKSYLVRLESPATFSDAGIAAARGFYASRVDPLWRKVVMVLATPLKRSWRHKWFTVTARFGATGAEEFHMLPEKTETPRFIYSDCIKPKASGELFLYVNDAVVGVPGLYDIFYRNNEGATKVMIKQIDACK